MPDIDGWDTFARIRADWRLTRNPDSFSHRQMTRKIERAKKMGAVDYIKKPSS